MKELLRIIKFVTMTPDMGLKFKPKNKNGAWQLRALNDSDFAIHKDIRRSVTGFVVYFLGVPMSWRRREMRSVVLSTTEAEYVSFSELVKELHFIIQVLLSIDISVELPIQVHCDNVGAIWLANKGGGVTSYGRPGLVRDAKPIYGGHSR